MALSATIRHKMTAGQTGTNDFGGPSFSPSIEAVINLANGNGANQADILWVDERTVAASSSDDIDLAGVLQSAFSGTITMARLVDIVIVNRPRDPTAPANVSRLTVGAGTNPVTGFLGGTAPTIGPIGPGGYVALGCPDALGLGTVTPGTADTLRITNGAGGPATYQIGILARS